MAAQQEQAGLRETATIAFRARKRWGPRGACTTR